MSRQSQRQFIDYIASLFCKVSIWFLFFNYYCFVLLCTEDEVFFIWVCAFGLNLVDEKLWKRKVKSLVLC